MRKVILNLAVTLDGSIEAPNGEIDWCSMEQNLNTEDFFDTFLSRIDAIFYGTVSYELWGQYRPDPNASAVEKMQCGAVHSKEKYVSSHQSKDDGWARYIHSDGPSELQAIKERPGKDIWLYSGANLITSFIACGLIDTYLLNDFPVILGSGKPLFSDIRNRVNLNLKQLRPAHRVWYCCDTIRYETIKSRKLLYHSIMD